MTQLSPEQIQDLKSERKAIKSEMKERGIKRTSCFNGGLSGDEYRFNARLFAIETQIGK